MKNYLSFDIGGTQIKFGVLTEKGDILEKGKIDTELDGQSIISNIVKIKAKYARLYCLEGVAFSVPGFVNVETGYLQTAGAIDDFYGINLKDIMTEKLALPVEIENDGNCVAIAEKWQGNAEKVANFICITIGSGIGGAIFINDQISRGHQYMAGEFGYMLTHNFFEAEDKGKTSMSFSASVKQGLRRRYCDAKPDLLMVQTSGEDIYQLAAQGDRTAAKVIDEFYQNIALGLFNLTFILNPQKILIGGAISERAELFPAVKQKFQEIIDAHGLLEQFTVSDFVTIESCKFNNDSGIVGAVYHFMKMAENRK